MKTHALESEIHELHSLKTMSKIYAELAAMRMNKKRKSVLYARQFLKELEIVFSEARRSYIAELKRKAAAGNAALAKKITLLSHNGKTVAVFLAANTRLYGDLIQRTFHDFIEDVQFAKSEATVVGRVGKMMYEEAMGETAPVTYFDMPDSTIDLNSLAQLIKHLVPYEEIHLYYGKFTNVVTQEPAMYPISSELTYGDDDQKPVAYFLFEPTIEAVLSYFATEHFGSLIEQTINESQLAKYAARLNAMDRAEQHVSTRLKKLKLQANEIKHATLNKQLVNETISRWRWFGK